MDWKYMGSVYEMEDQPMTYGTSWELPIIVPLTNEAGTLMKYIFMIDMTSYTYNAENGTISGDTKNKGGAASLNHVSGPLMLEDGKLAMEIYVDRSLVEAFFNDTKSISMRSYSDYDSQGSYNSHQRQFLLAYKLLRCESMAFT